MITRRARVLYLGSTYGVSEPTDRQLPPDPHDGIDAAANADARAYQAHQTPPLARASSGGVPPSDAPPAGEAPEVEGTGAGDPLAGVHADDRDVAEAVPGDDGPEHPGVRRLRPEPPRPTRFTAPRGSTPAEE